MPSLANANIRFHTNNEDKDDDTHLTVDVTDGNNVRCAHVDNDFGKFNDNSDTGPFPLQVLNASSEDDCVRGNVRIRIDPNGDDTWRFNFLLTLIFDDNTSLTAGADGLEVTQDRQEQTFGIQGIRRS